VAVSANFRIKAALALTYVVFAVLLNSVGTVILQSVQSFGVSKLDASLLESFKDLSIAATSVAVVSFLPRFGYRRAMMCALAFVSVACALMPLWPTFATTELLFATVGVSFAVTKIALYTSVGLLTRGQAEHASLTNILEGMFMVGTLSGYWLFSAFVSTPGGSAGWLNVYWVLAAAALLALALLASSPLREVDGAVRLPGAARSSWRESWRVLARPLVYVFLLSAFLYVLIEQSVGTWLPTFNREVLQLPTGMSVQLASLFAGMLAIGRLSAGYLLRRVSWYVLLNCCIAAMAAVIVLTLPLAGAVKLDAPIRWISVPVAAYLMPMFGLFMAPIYPVINSVALSAMPPRLHATMAGLIVVFSALGGASGSRVTAMAFSHFGGQRAFYWSLVPVTLLIAALFFFRQRIEQATYNAAKPMAR
jgi:fucose permease